jgi:hypothetical protein
MLRRLKEAIAITILTVGAAVLQGVAAAVWVAEEACKMCKTKKKDDDEDNFPP